MKKMVKRVKRFLSVLVMAALVAGNFDFVSFAANAYTLPETKEAGEPEVLEAKVIEDVEWFPGISTRTMLVDCIIGVSGDSEGMHISISTATVGTASVLGVKDVKIYKKISKGKWELVATSSGGESYKRATMGIDILYSNAVKGATYKITCVHYGNVNGYIEDDHDSGEFVFTY